MTLYTCDIIHFDGDGAFGSVFEIKAQNISITILLLDKELYKVVQQKLRNNYNYAIIYET